MTIVSIPESEKDSVNKEINNDLDRIDSNKNESTYIYEIKRKELKNKLDPILQKIDANIIKGNLQFAGCLSDSFD